MSQTVRVNFSKPMPLFPLRGTVLLPHAVQPLHIFEPRYRQMIDETLDRAGQVAMACFTNKHWAGDGDGLPPLRPVVCVGQIIRHETFSGGQHNILLHGVCRATIRRMMEPSEQRLYRMASLAPLSGSESESPQLNDARMCLRKLLSGPRLRRMRSVGTVLEWFDRDDVPTHALLELVGFTLVQDPELKYNLLAETCPARRAGLIRSELTMLDRLVLLADRQSWNEWPKGMSWN